MARLSFVRCVYALAALSTYANGHVTVYKVGDDKNSQLTATTTAGAASYTGSAAYDPTVLNPPAPPDRLNRDYTIQVNLALATKEHNADIIHAQLPQGGMSGLSIPQSGSYLGFSIELSVATRV
ncbi:hypothetical protein FRC06_006963, partial [Ceratobasidium sp. 370]